MAVVTIATDFSGKVEGDLSENSNVARFTHYASSGDRDTSADLRLPIEIGETSQSNYNFISAKNGSGAISYAEDNTRPQIIFSFNVIRAIENIYGNTLWRGKTTLADKIEIAKSIVTNLTVIITGYNFTTISGVTEINKYISALTTANVWDDPAIITTSNKMTYTDASKTITLEGYIDTDGYIHFNAYGNIDDDIDGSNLDSVMNIDYPKLEITLDDSLAPETPTGLTASPEVGAITLNWTGVTGATSYNVYRSMVSGSGYEFIGTTGEMVYVDHISTTDSTIYYYVVTAVNEHGTSEHSQETTIQAIPEPIPEPQPEPEPQQEYTERNIFLPAQYWGSDGSITEEGRKMLVDKHSLSGKRVSITSQPPIVSVRIYN